MQCYLLVSPSSADSIDAAPFQIRLALSFPLQHHVIAEKRTAVSGLRSSNALQTRDTGRYDTTVAGYRHKLQIVRVFLGLRDCS